MNQQLPIRLPLFLLIITVLFVAGWLLFFRVSWFEKTASDILDFVPTTTDPALLPPCIRTGCSGQVCADRSEITTCEYLPKYGCYKQAVCERQESGRCGWTKTQAFAECLERL